MSKKVIEQETVKGIEVHKLECLTVVYQFGKAPIDIEESKATEVAKAIDPEYQKVIDQNAKLVEASKTKQEEIQLLKNALIIVEHHLKTKVPVKYVNIHPMVKIINEALNTKKNQDGSPVN